MTKASAVSIEDAIGEFRTIASGGRVKPKTTRQPRKTRRREKAAVKPLNKEAEIFSLSTPEERSACEVYKSMRRMEWMDEGDMFVYGQAVAILVARNKRLGLIS